ncbi:MAG TPA: serine/threonine-protein kinase [Candidatus Dormibacteraeota bacterium]|jgi:serine/threonine protein kinase|nr:serine/threonine-protein kinase [Candidatus Dormibacteraeota bacterium]
MTSVVELAGSTVAAYELLECLGHGSCTAVYRTSGGGEERAVKVVDDRLLGEEELAPRLRRERTVLDRIGHQGILPIREATHVSGMTVVATPLKRAPTLHELMLHGRLDAEEAWNLLSQIAESLDLVHEQGLAYRVLKPVNVLVEDGRAYLAEFGATGQRLGPLALSTPSFRVSQPQYLAPEQVEGKRADPRTDLYAFGVLAFELATRTPFHQAAPPAEVLRATLEHPPPSASACNPRVPPDADPVLRRALSKDPQQRPRSARELLEELVYPTHRGPAVAAPSVVAPTPVFPLQVLPELDLSEIESDRQGILDSFLAACVRLGRQVAGPRWPVILAHAGLQDYLLHDPPESGELVPEMLALSRLADGFEATFGQDAPRHLHHWGELVGEHWLRSIQERPPWIAGPPTGRLVDVLSVFVEALNRLRGEELFSWNQVNRALFRVIHERNIMAVGRRRQTEACHFWRGAYEAALRWAGLAEEWLVAEVECGCVSGTYDCIFTIVRNEPAR